MIRMATLAQSNYEETWCLLPVNSIIQYHYYWWIIILLLKNIPKVLLWMKVRLLLNFGKLLSNRYYRKCSYLGYIWKDYSPRSNVKRLLKLDLASIDDFSWYFCKKQVLFYSIIGSIKLMKRNFWLSF